MNVRNQADLSLDDALNEYLRSLFKAYFVDGDAVKLLTDLRAAEARHKAASKTLDEL